MTREEILRKLDQVDDAINRRDGAAAAAVYADDARFLDGAAPGGRVEGREAVRQYMEGYFRAFPDLQWDRIGVEIDGNTAVEEWRASGTQEGDLPGLPATRKRMTVDGCSVMRFEDDGLVHEEHNYWDEAQMLRHLGAIPEPAAAR